MCGIQGTGNPPLPLTEEQCKDTGTRRRINYVRMPREFTLAEDKLLKGAVNAGKCNPELMFLCTHLAPYVATCGKRIEPRPPRVLTETQQLLDMTLTTDVKQYVESNFKTVNDAWHATAQPKVRDIIAKQFPALGDQCERYLKKAGLEPERCKKVRYYTYLFPLLQHPLPIAFTGHIGQEAIAAGNAAGNATGTDGELKTENEIDAESENKPNRP